MLAGILTMVSSPLLYSSALSRSPSGKRSAVSDSHQASVPFSRTTAATWPIVSGVISGSPEDRTVGDCQVRLTGMTLNRSSIIVWT